MHLDQDIPNGRLIKDSTVDGTELLNCVTFYESYSTTELVS